MELKFETKRLRSMCQEHEIAVTEIGEPAALVLRRRIADLRAANYLANLPVGRPTVVDGAHPQLFFDLREGWVLRAAVVGRSIPRMSDNRLDQARVRRVLVQEISR